jgi:hypothetical protein
MTGFTHPTYPKVRVGRVFRYDAARYEAGPHAAHEAVQAHENRVKKPHFTAKDL